MDVSLDAITTMVILQVGARLEILGQAVATYGEAGADELLLVVAGKERGARLHGGCGPMLGQSPLPPQGNVVGLLRHPVCGSADEVIDGQGATSRARGIRHPCTNLRRVRNSEICDDARSGDSGRRSIASAAHGATTALTGLCLEICGVD